MPSRCSRAASARRTKRWETLTLVQTGKRDLMPIVCVDYPGSTYWSDWLQYVRKHLLDERWISPADLSLVKVVSSAEEAVDEILGFYSVYNSMRFIREKLYLRLHRAPDDALLEQLNIEFADIIASGRIERVTAHPYESDDEHLADLPRLAFVFNRRDYGRLREMVGPYQRRVDGGEDHADAGRVSTSDSEPLRSEGPNAKHPGC